MTQTNLFLEDKQEDKIKKFKEKWHKSKHDVIKKMINEYIEWLKMNETRRQMYLTYVATIGCFATAYTIGHLVYVLDKLRVL